MTPHAAQEPTFNWGGFAAAMGSNLTFQSRNVLSKKLMGGAKGIKKVRSRAVCMRGCVLTRGVACVGLHRQHQPLLAHHHRLLLPHNPRGAAHGGRALHARSHGHCWGEHRAGARASRSSALSPRSRSSLRPPQIVQRTLLAGLCFHGYQQVSYMILQRVSPVTHSVGNCVKRVIVIVSSVLFFRTPVRCAAPAAARCPLLTPALRAAARSMRRAPPLRWRACSSTPASPHPRARRANELRIGPGQRNTKTLLRHCSELSSERRSGSRSSVCRLGVW